MKKKTAMKFATLLIALSFAALPVVLSAGQDVHKHSHHGKSHSATNPLIEEMIILDGVFREVVSAVSLGDGEKVHEVLHHMHGTMEKPTKEFMQEQSKSLRTPIGSMNL